MDLGILKVFGLASISFFTAMALTPFLTHYLYTYKCWKKKVRTQATDGGETPITTALYAKTDNARTGTPRMGGALIWVSTLIVTLFFFSISELYPGTVSEKFNFLSRGQTWLPLFTLVVASILGLIDDLLQVIGKGGYIDGGLSLRARIITVIVIGSIGAWWFYAKLGMSSIMIPFFGEFGLGILFIPLFIITMLALFSGGVIDGVDGLSGGVMAAAFSAYAGIAFIQNQVDLATFSAVIAGATLAFLWFNIPPARFYMSETGMLGLTTTLAVVAFLTQQVAVLAIIAFPLIATGGSTAIQLFSKRFRGGKKVFLAAPLHHHFQALGWGSPKVTMRYWVVSVVLAVLGLILAIL